MFALTTREQAGHSAVTDGAPQALEKLAKKSTNYIQVIVTAG
jgi:hypothetical protein